MTDENVSLDSLAEDLEDLRATVHGFATQLEHNTKLVDQLAAARQAGDTNNGDDKEAAGGKDDEPKAPPFILRLSGAEYEAELAALISWVNNLLVPVYLTEVSSSATWCAAWWNHPAAVARFHASWLAWQELTDPETGGRTGPSVWHRDHLDPMLIQLRDASGPFAGCMTNPDRRQHADLPAPPVDPSPGGSPRHT